MESCSSSSFSGLLSFSSLRFPFVGIASSSFVALLASLAVLAFSSRSAFSSALRSSATLFSASSCLGDFFTLSILLLEFDCLTYCQLRMSFDLFVSWVCRLTYLSVAFFI